MSIRLFVRDYTNGHLRQPAETYVISCKDASKTVGGLKLDVLGRKAGNQEGYQLFLAGSDAILREDDSVGSVLRDGDHLCLCKSRNYREISFHSWHCCHYVCARRMATTLYAASSDNYVHSM